MLNVLAISLFDEPEAIILSTSTSRLVSSFDLSFIKSLSAKRTFSNGTSVGSMYVCPSYTVIIAFFNVSKSESLSIYPSQLKSIALIKYSISL